MQHIEASTDKCFWGHVFPPKSGCFFITGLVTNSLLPTMEASDQAASLCGRFLEQSAMAQGIGLTPRIALVPLYSPASRRSFFSSMTCLAYTDLCSLSRPTAGGSAPWPRPLSGYHFSRKTTISIQRFLVEPWPKPALAEQNFSPLFLEQFWLRSGGQLQPGVGLLLIAQFTKE